MRRAARLAPVLLAAGVITLGAAGCRNKEKPAAKKETLKEQIQREARKKLQQAPPLAVDMQGNSFTVDDENGRRLLEAKVEKVDGKVVSGKGLDGPVRLTKAKCRLFQNGKPQLDLEAPEATWDGTQLVSEKTTHAVTPHKDRVIDGTRAVWTAADGKLELEKAKVQSLEKGKVEFTVDAPTATVLNRVATMPKGAVGKNAKGEQVTGDRVQWYMDQKEVDIQGNVVATEPGGRRATAGHARWKMASETLDADGTVVATDPGGRRLTAPRIHWQLGRQQIDADRGIVVTDPEGEQVTANQVRWHLGSGRLEANGSVVLSNTDTRVTGQRLIANTKLKKGRLTGGTRVVMRKAPLRKKDG